jgi:hypothetical protein
MRYEPTLVFDKRRPIPTNHYKLRMSIYNPQVAGLGTTALQYRAGQVSTPNLYADGTRFDYWTEGESLRDFALFPQTSSGLISYGNRSQSIPSTLFQISYTNLSYHSTLSNQ